MQDRVLSLSPSYLKTVIIVEGRKSPLLRDARIFFLLWFNNVLKIFLNQHLHCQRTNINFVGAKDALKIRGSLARADLPVPEFFSRNKAQILLGSGHTYLHDLNMLENLIYTI